MSSPGPEDPRVTRNRAAVHAAVLGLLAAEGAAGLTVDRIAEASGVSRSTIYRHWPDLRDLVVAAFDGAVHTFARQRAPTGDVEADLHSYLQDYAERLNDPAYAAVILAVLEWSWRDPAFAQAHARTFDDARSRAAGILRGGIRAGRLRADLDVRSAVEAVVSPFLYRRIVLRRTITRREVDALHRRLLGDLGS